MIEREGGSICLNFIYLYIYIFQKEHFLQLFESDLLFKIFKITKLKNILKLQNSVFIFTLFKFCV